LAFSLSSAASEGYNQGVVLPAQLGLEALRERGILRSVDLHFARMVSEESGDRREIVLLAAALASRAPAYGHVCVNLSRIDKTIRIESDEVEQPTLSWPTGTAFVKALSNSPIVGQGRNYSKPLMLSGERLFLSRYWLYQLELKHDLKHRCTRVFDVDALRIRRDIGLLFPECLVRDASKGREQRDLLDTIELSPSRQLVAAITALRRGLTVICGGPGTGKTTTVVRILAMLVEAATNPPNIILLAPTGKAASRLGQSVARAKHSGAWFPPGTKEHIPESSLTVHRALGLGGLGRPPRYDRSNPLDADVVVVDEASMVDLSLMTKVFAAVRPEARLILLGDPDQLASVEAGAVLSDLVSQRNDVSTEASTFYREVLETLPDDLKPTREDSGLWDCIVELDTSHRFDSTSGIGRLATMVNEGRSSDACMLLKDTNLEDLHFVRTRSAAETQRQLLSLVGPHFASQEDTEEAADAVGELSRLRVLTPHRRGSLGATRLNRTVESWLHAQSGRPADTMWYSGKPILVTRNDALLDVYNGDMGVVFKNVHHNDHHVLFESTGSGPLRQLHPARLPPHETVYAMTVHKSQGSEFQEVVLVLPEKPSPILTRELLYTAITRARQKVTIIGSLEVFSQTIDECIERSSGFSNDR
jgi:exodeoxyribonuclease V alpha subunit